MTTDRLRALLAEATSRPWTESGRDVDHDKMVAEGRNPGDACGLGCEIDGPPEAYLRGQFQNHADAALIVAAVNALPALLDALEQARDRLEGVFEAVHPEPWTGEDMERIAQDAWFGMQEIDDALAAAGGGEAGE